uniref:TRAF3-interacting protein 1 n=1 Tax=Loxodonta africana TaxID=9785 RepID=G3UHY4_LOXAF
MNAAVVRRTQDALGKVIRRPPLTEKLLYLKRFLYLAKHDLVIHVIRMTGFMKGLYTDAEMKSDNVKDKDAKISFLQKAIDVVVMVSGEPLSAKPARIVAGHEPERTNELLQTIGRCCLSKLSSDDAVKRVLAGEKGDRKGRPSKSQDLGSKNAKEEEPRVPKNKEDRRNSEIKERSPSKDQKPKEELKEESKPSNKDRDREADREHSRDPDREKSREHEKLEKKSTGPGEASKKSSDGSFKDSKAEIEENRRDRPRDGDEEKKKKRPINRKRLMQKVKGRRSSRAGEHSLSPEKDCSSSCGKAKERAVRQLAKTGSATAQAGSACLTGRKEDNISAKILDSIVSGLNNEPDQETTASEIDDNSASLWRENAEPEPAAKRQGDSPSDAEGDSGPTGQEKSEVSENSEIPNELSSNLRKIPRPGSARPAPPRVKRQESAEVLAVDRAGSGKAVSNVIADSQNSENEEDDQFVVETAPQLSEMSEIDMVPAVELEEDEKHGGLVKKILETKDYEKLQQSPRAGEKEKLLVYESAWKKEKDIVSKEIEKLRMSIQTLCKSALPLGKMMDYIQEDVDAMQSELQLWHSESRQHAEALHREQSITDCAVEPLKAELAELEQLIRDQQDKICAVKANILKNEEKIQKMVYSINLSSRR